jgi:alkylation response protein AidB-like acyl-CoA dehydrogenase
MRLHYDERTERFRAELRAFIADHLPTREERSEPVRSSAHIPEWGRRWQRTLFDHGWLVPGWPPELGGRNATPVEQMVYFEELSRLEVPRAFNPQGLSIITPSIVDAGTEEQTQRFALPTLRAEIAWCLGMSEPDAGSDLASLRTRAELAGDHFVVNGQKIWTSGAHDADYCFCFVRTDPDAPKHRGISVLVIDMRSPGVEARPFPSLSSRDRVDFNEVFFTDVVVPRENLVGPLHGGWSIAGGSLAHERGMLWIWQVTGLERAIERLVAEAATRERGRRLGDDVLARDRIAAHYVDVQAMRLMGYRGFAKLTHGRAAPEHSVLKLFGSELRQHLALDATEAWGVAGIESDRREDFEFDDRRFDLAPWGYQYLASFGNTIAGGTSEIQRNIIAERVLGLPR